MIAQSQRCFAYCQFLVLCHLQAFVLAAPAFLAGLSRIRAGWGSKSLIYSRLNGICFRVGEQSLTAQHSTRPLDLVQAISRYTCRTHIALSESESPQGHLAHIVPSESITNIVSRARSKYILSNSVWWEATMNILFLVPVIIRTNPFFHLL